jgi:beta-phosphoglucomutase family hydrolase
MKSYKAFIFDMNGTIIDDMGYHIAAWLEILAELGHPITTEAFAKQLSGKTNEETLREVMGADFPEEQIAAISKDKEIVYQQTYRAHLKPVAGFLPFLQAAQKTGLPVAVATSANQFNIDFTLAGLGLEGALTAVIGAGDIENSKPHPEIFLKAAAAMGIAPEDCLVFEDSFMGIEAARQANMDAYAILTTLTSDEALALPNVIGAAPDFSKVKQDFFYL